MWMWPVALYEEETLSILLSPARAMWGHREKVDCLQDRFEFSLGPTHAFTLTWDF